MGKKDKKKSAKQDKGSPADAVRAAVEQAFAATAGSASFTRGRAQELVDDITSAAARVRDTLEDLRVLEDLKGLRTEVDALARRVAALEAAGAEPAGAAQDAKPARRASAGTKPAGTKAPAKPRTRRTAAAKAPAKPRTRRAATPKPAATPEPADTASEGRS